MQATDTHIGKSECKQIRTDNGNLICEAFTDPDTGKVHVHVYQNGREDAIKVISHVW